MPSKSKHTSKKSSVVWVTGASRGIGREVTRVFAENGYRVVATSRNTGGLSSLAQAVREKGGVLRTLRCDVRSTLNVAAVTRKILSQFGQIDILVNNAGVTSFNTFRKTNLREFDEIILTNLTGTFLCTKAVLESMIQRRSGHIFNILSVTTVKTFRNSAAYAASKAGALALSNVLREEVREHNIKVTNVIAGATETLMWSPAYRRKYRQRMMRPEDIANVILNICQAPERTHVEQIIVRPVLGDLP